MDTNNFTLCAQKDCTLRERCVRYVESKSELPNAIYFSQDPRESDGSCSNFIAPNQLNFNF